MKPPPRPACAWSGCTTTKGQRTPYCAQHVRIAKQCAFDGCEVRIAHWNFHGLCPEHRWLAKK